MSGNGKQTSPVTIDMIQMGSDWVYFEPGRESASREQLPLLLGQTMIQWLQDNPSIVVRSTLPIVAGGATVGIHVWYDQRRT